jgi:hypothetical protein
MNILLLFVARYGERAGVALTVQAVALRAILIVMVVRMTHSN